MTLNEALSLHYEKLNLRRPDDVARLFQGAQTEIKSPHNPTYNCLAWTIGEKAKWWDVDRWWPPGSVPGPNVRHLIDAYVALRFEECGFDDSVEPGYDKVAIFAIGDDWTHGCRQHHDGKWWSKLGEEEDTLHTLKEAEQIPIYGKVAVILKRPRNPSAPSGCASALRRAVTRRRAK